ncbi:MAG: hypothetical protein DHS20C13_06250 [Thermodesulfobacteriota bacterium]|nr:MAG: hypothetical protein DHS20C13_06250 [Thermodesulfobacteriota bacterium]
MDIIIILIITAAAAIYIALPFFIKKRDLANETLMNSYTNKEDPVTEKLKILDNKKETLLSAIRDIEFDYGLGKLSKEDFEELNNKYKLEAASVLKEIDEIQKQDDRQTPGDDIESEILSYRKTGDSDDTLIEEEITAFRSANQNNESKIKCQNCGSEHRAGDLFCSKCGAKLN